MQRLAVSNDVITLFTSQTHSDGVAYSGLSTSQEARGACGRVAAEWCRFSNEHVKSLWVR